MSVGFFESATGDVGLLWYAKPALTRDMPASLLAHRETHPDFPRTSTLDQFFDTSTFVAYRNLGRYNAQMIREARVALLEDMDAAVRLWEQSRRSPTRRGPVYTDAFEAFRALERRDWAAVEIAGLICRRTSLPARRLELFDRIRRALCGDQVGGVAPAEVPVQRDPADDREPAG